MPAPPLVVEGAPRVAREAAAFASSLPTPAVLTYFPETKPRSRKRQEETPAA